MYLLPIYLIPTYLDLLLNYLFTYVPIVLAYLT